MRLGDYSEKTGLPITFLNQLGLFEKNDTLYIPYFNHFNKLQRYRIRKGNKRWWSPDPDGEYPIIPYGIWLMRDNTGDIYLAEGESDCQTLIFHGFNALGIPGASSFKAEWTIWVMGYDRVIICPDTDNGGRVFAENVTQKIKEYRNDSSHGFEGNILVMNLPEGVKDINELLGVVTNAG